MAEFDIDRYEAGKKQRKPKVGIDPSVVGTKAGALITPEQIAATGTEHAHQAAFFQWIAITGSKAMAQTELMFAVPNGGDRKASVAASLKAEGVKSGVPDVCWPVPRLAYVGLDEWYHGLWIELKRPGLEKTKNGGRSDKQVEWHTKLIGLSYAVVVAYGWQSMAWAAWLYSQGELRMPSGGDAMMATAVAEPPVVTN
ncbi:VRR-NUC endonuclease domain-containing protein [Rhizobium phage RHph_N17]|nr:VRR-NUC endonuclease domain-containing protein [Rhizobium phage RHph_N17]